MAAKNPGCSQPPRVSDTGSRTQGAKPVRENIQGVYRVSSGGHPVHKDLVRVSPQPILLVSAFSQWRLKYEVENCKKKKKSF